MGACGVSEALSGPEPFPTWPSPLERVAAAHEALRAAEGLVGARAQAVRDALAAGHSAVEIAEVLGCSRQRVYQVAQHV